MPERAPVDPEHPELEPTVEIEQAGTRLLGDRRRVLTVLAAFVLLIVGIYVLLPKVVGLHDALDSLSDPNWAWIAVALAFCLASFLAYAALFRGVLRGGDHDVDVYRRIDLSASYKITMAARAARVTSRFTAIFSSCRSKKRADGSTAAPRGSKGK